MFHYHEYIFMPKLNFDDVFWKKINKLRFSYHAKTRSSHRKFPLLSLEKVRSEGHIYEICVDETGINKVCVFISMCDGRDLHYVLDKKGMIITGWFLPSYQYPFPVKSRIYKEF